MPYQSLARLNVKKSNGQCYDLMEGICNSNIAKVEKGTQILMRAFCFINMRVCLRLVVCKVFACVFMRVCVLQTFESGRALPIATITNICTLYWKQNQKRQKPN